MSRLVSRLRIVFGALALACGLALACNTPSVPLPPPLIQDMKFTTGPTAGSVILTSPPQPNIGAARFSVFNESQGVGVIVVSNNDGSFTTPPFAGNNGDYIQISYERGNDTAAACTTLNVGGSLTNSFCQ